MVGDTYDSKGDDGDEGDDDIFCMEEGPSSEADCSLDFYGT
jgi:hypothetical protein